jgi:hypothetical protein
MYLFVMYLATLSVSHTIQCRTLSSMIMNYKECERNQSFANIICFLGILLERLRKTKKNLSEYSRCRSQDPNKVSPESRAEPLPVEAS